MKYDMTKPCDACPFKRGSKLQLDHERIDEIAGQFVDGSDRGQFVCHKTAEIDEDTGGFAPKRLGAEGPESRHCAGALIFAEKNGTPTQMMRIAHRLGMYNPAAMDTYRDEVYDDLDDMHEHALGEDDPPDLKSKLGARKRHARSKVAQQKPRARGKA